MEAIKRLRIFQKAATSIFLIFMTIMVLVFFYSFLRKTGSTGLDMQAVQKMRIDHQIKKQQNRTNYTEVNSE